MRPEDDMQATDTLAIEQSATRLQDLAHVLRVKQREQWLADNTEAMTAYNVQVERHGVFSDGLRSF